MPLSYKFFPAVLVLPALSACDLTPPAAPAARPLPTVHAPPPGPTARTVEQFDTTTAAERVAAAAPATGGTNLGTTVATLGSPAEPGFWLRTPLVSVERAGRVVDPASGKAAQVTLLPLPGAQPGAGSQISLAALRVLGLPLTAISDLLVFAE